MQIISKTYPPISSLQHHIHLRLMTISDIDSLISLWKKAGLNTVSKHREKMECAKLLELNPTSCFVAVDNGTIIGNVFGAFNGRRAWLYHVAVHPKYQQLGIGSLLVNKAKENLKSRGATRILVGVLFNNLKVASFYEKLGFSPMNEAVHFQLDL